MNPPADRDIVAVVEASAVVRAVARVVDALSAAGRTSVGLRWLTAARAAWLGQGAVDRTRGVGLGLIVAALVHLALASWQGPTAGWLWLVVPMAALAFGGLMALAPARGLHSERGR